MQFSREDGENDALMSCLRALAPLSLVASASCSAHRVFRLTFGCISEQELAVDGDLPTSLVAAFIVLDSTSHRQICFIHAFDMSVWCTKTKSSIIIGTMKAYLPLLLSTSMIMHIFVLVVLPCFASIAWFSLSTLTACGFPFGVFHSAAYSTFVHLSKWLQLLFHPRYHALPF